MMFEKLTADSRQVIVAAKEKAVARGDRQIGAAHVLYALTVTEGVASRVLAGLGVDAGAAEQALEAAGGGAAGAAGATIAPGDGDGLAGSDPDAEALKAIGIDLDEIRRKAEESFGAGALDRVRPGSAQRGLAIRRAGERSPLDSDVRTALGMSLRASRALHTGYVGTEHLLLGLVGAGERSGSAVPGLLLRLRLDAAQVREHVVAEVSGTAH
jgi:ATP-dependent Clp protease ATP-binding subunit ClpA